MILLLLAPLALSFNFSKRGNLCSQPSAAIPDVLPVEQRFHIEFSCEDPNQEKCSLASELVKSAGLRIASQLNIRRAVVVSVMFKPLNDIKTLASTDIPQWWAANRAKSPQRLYYPQSLAKQAAISEKLPWDPNSKDIVIEINSNIDWGFFDKGLKKFVKLQRFSLENTVALELTRGLGFTSQLTDYKDMYERKFSYLAPILVKGSTAFSRAVAPISVFDSLINAPNVLLDLSEAINGFHDLKMFEGDFLTEIEKNQGFISAAKALFSYLTSGKVEILLPGAVVIPLEASRGKFGPENSFPFLKGSLGSEETFMTSAKSMVVVPKAKSMYGPKTLKIMETLGYETETNPCTIALQKFSTY